MLENEAGCRITHAWHFAAAAADDDPDDPDDPVDDPDDPDDPDDNMVTIMHCCVNVQSIHLSIKWIHVSMDQPTNE